MNSQEKKFFRLHYLCSNTPNSIQNQKLILERTIKNESNIEKIRSKIISVSQNFDAKNIKKINNSKSQLNKRIRSNFSNKTHNFIRRKSNIEKNINDIYSSYFYEKTMPPLNHIKNDDSNKTIFKTKKYNNNNNFSQLNFTINNFIPFVENKSQNIKGRNRTYFISIENSNHGNKNNKDLNLRQSYYKERGKNIKSFLYFKNNFNESKNNEQEFLKDDVYKNNLSIININDKKEIDEKNKRIKFNLAKIINNKNGIRLLIKNNRKNRNFKIKKNFFNIDNKTEYDSMSLSNNISKNKIRKIKENKNLNNNNNNSNTHNRNYKTDNVSKIRKRINDIVLKKDIERKNLIIKEKEEIIQTLLNKYEQSKERIKYLEKNYEDLKKENDSLYKYKSLYDDKEIELIQYKNNINKYEIDNDKYNYLKKNYDELLEKYNTIQEIKDNEINSIKNRFNDLYIKYNNIKLQLNELDDLKILRTKYSQLLAENEHLNEIKNKYNKIINEYEELKVIRERYRQILKEQKNLLLIENKYNDLYEEIKDLREIKNEYENIKNNKRSHENNLFKNNNISFGVENGII